MSTTCTEQNLPHRLLPRRVLARYQESEGTREGIVNHRLAAIVHPLGVFPASDPEARIDPPREGWFCLPAARVHQFLANNHLWGERLVNCARHAARLYLGSVLTSAVLTYRPSHVRDIGISSALARASPCDDALHVRPLFHLRRTRVRAHPMMPSLSSTPIDDCDTKMPPSLIAGIARFFGTYPSRARYSAILMRPHSINLTPHELPRTY